MRSGRTEAIYLACLEQAKRGHKPLLLTSLPVEVARLRLRQLAERVGIDRAAVGRVAIAQDQGE